MGCALDRITQVSRFDGRSDRIFLEIQIRGWASKNKGFVCGWKDSYSSAPSLNEIPTLFVGAVRWETADNIRSFPHLHFSVMMDGTRDVSGDEQEAASQICWQGLSPLWKYVLVFVRFLWLQERTWLWVLCYALPTVLTYLPRIPYYLHIIQLSFVDYTFFFNVNDF